MPHPFRFAASLALACVMLLLSACAQLPRPMNPHDARIQAPPPRIIVLGVTEQDRLNNQILARLREPRRFEFHNRPLVVIIDQLQHETGLNFFVNWAALDSAGIAKDIEPSELIVRESAYEVLEHIVRYINAEGPSEPVSFAVIDGVVRISTADDLNSHTVTRMYVLPATVLQPMSTTPTLPEFDPRAPLLHLSGSSRPKPDGNEDDVVVIDNRPTDIVTFNERMDVLITLIQDNIGDQREWQAYGGQYNSIRDYNGALIIRTTPAQHAEIEALLADLSLPHGIQYALQSEEAGHLITRADDLRLNNQHRQALVLVNSALRVAPDDARAQALHEVLTQSVGQKFRYEPIRPALAQVDRSLVTVGPLPLSQFPLSATDDDAPLKDALRRLNDPISVKFEGDRLIHVFEQLQRITSVPFTIHWDPLESAGIEQDLPITLEFKQVPARVVLDLVLKQAEAGALLEPIDYDVCLTKGSPGRANVVVSTRRHLIEDTVLREYPLQDILASGGGNYSTRLLYAHKNRPLIDSMRFDSLAMAMADACFPHADTLTTYEEEVESLAILIQEVIDAGPNARRSDWAKYGGYVSSLKEWQGTLYIKTDAATHREIENFLTQLRHARRISLASLMRHREVLPLLRQAESHRMAQRYSAALKLLEQALQVDPQHEYALAMREVIHQTLYRKGP